MSNRRLVAAVERLLQEGESVLATNQETSYSNGGIVEKTSFARWLAGGRNLVRMLGRYAEPWADEFQDSADYYEVWRAQKMQATLLAIKDAIDHNMLLDVEDLIVAETFDDLLQQGQYLLSEGYFVAAGVLGRAVLEEHLRKWCQHAGCLPAHPKPTLNHYYQELYRAKKFNVSVLKHIEAMAAVGNDAAHNKPDLSASDVQRLLRDLEEFLGKHPLSSGGG